MCFRQYLLSWHLSKKGHDVKGAFYLIMTYVPKMPRHSQKRGSILHAKHLSEDFQDICLKCLVSTKILQASILKFEWPKARHLRLLLFYVCRTSFGIQKEAHISNSVLFRDNSIKQQQEKALSLGNLKPKVSTDIWMFMQCENLLNILLPTR